MIHGDHHTFGAVRQIHGAPDTAIFTPRHPPVGQISLSRDLKPAQDGHIEMTAPDHGKGHGRVKAAGARSEGNILRTGVNQVRVLIPVFSQRATPEHAVFGMQDDFDAGRHVVGNQRRDADAKVDGKPVLQFLRRALGDLLSTKSTCHRFLP